MSYLAEIANLKNRTFEFKKVKLSLPKDAVDDLKYIFENGVSHEEFLLLALKKINLKSFRKEIEKARKKEADEPKKSPETDSRLGHNQEDVKTHSGPRDFGKVL